MSLKPGYKLVNLQKIFLNFRVLYSSKAVDYCRAANLAKPEDIPKGIWTEEGSSKYTSVEEVKDHWHYVERLFPKFRVPNPPKQVSNVGWKAPAENVPDLPYYIKRTRNHMLPVYETAIYKNQILATKVCKVHGDIWKLEYDLKTYLEEKLGEKVESDVNEIVCKVHFKGKHMETIKEWLYNKGF